MSFPDFQRQIEIVSDPAVVEQWKEQARSVTTLHDEERRDAGDLQQRRRRGAAFPADLSADTVARARASYD